MTDLFHDLYGAGNDKFKSLSEKSVDIKEKLFKDTSVTDQFHNVYGAGIDKFKSLSNKSVDIKDKLHPATKKAALCNFMN